MDKVVLELGTKALALIWLIVKIKLYILAAVLGVAVVVVVLAAYLELGDWNGRT